MRLDDLTRALRPLATRMRNLLRRGVITGVDDAKKVQEDQISGLVGETRDEIESFQPYGFTSNPPKGLSALIAWLTSDHGVALGFGDSQWRVKNLPTGEVCVYSKFGQTIVLKTNGDIEATPKAGQKFKFIGDVDVSGTLTATTDVVGGGKSLKTHTHSVAGANSGGPVVFTPVPAITGAPS